MNEIIDQAPFSCDRIPQDRLAEVVLHQLMACAVAQIEEPAGRRAGFSTQPGLRIVSWVENGNFKLGHALAISSPYPNPNDLIQSRLYNVDREKLAVIGSPKTLVVRDDMPTYDDGFERYRDEITAEFDHEDLTHTLYMLDKACGAYKMARIAPEKSDVFQCGLDHYVKLALMDDNLDELARLFPGGTQTSETGSDEDEASPEHILEWALLIETASQVFKENADRNETYQEMALQHEHQGQLYTINLYGYYRTLTGMQILWQNDGAWEGRIYDFDPEVDDDDLFTNQPDPQWDRQAILTTVQSGMTIPRHIFQGYLAEALK